MCEYVGSPPGGLRYIAALRCRALIARYYTILPRKSLLLPDIKAKKNCQHVRICWQPARRVAVYRSTPTNLPQISQRFPQNSHKIPIRLPKSRQKKLPTCANMLAVRKIPGIVLLSHSQIYRTIAAGALNYRVREGNECFCSAMDTGKYKTKK